jgi:hypothetical protein
MGLQATRVEVSTDGHLRFQWTVLALVVLCVPLVTHVGAQGTLGGPTDDLIVWYII